MHDYREKHLAPARNPGRLPAAEGGVLMVEKLQYFPKDLSKALGIGEIIEMHVDHIKGQDVLRITCESNEYKTVKPSRRQEQPKVKPEKTITDKAAGALSAWWNKPSKAPWERKF